MYAQYMCILLYVKVIWCNGIPQIYCELEVWWVDVYSVHVHSAICDTYLGVMVFHRSIVNWSWGWQMYPQYMCILLYVKVIWCNGIPQIYCELEVWWVDVYSVHVHSAICDTYQV